MTGKQLFESMQYLDDSLLCDHAEADARPRRWMSWAAAACLVLAFVGAAFFHGPKAADVGAHTDSPNSGQIPVAGESSARPVQRVGVPGPGAEPAAAPENAGLVWNETDGALAQDVGIAGVMMVGEALSAAQLADCAPEIRLEWMKQMEGTAVYYLKDGAGGLAFVELRVTNPAGGSAVTIRIRDKNAPEMPFCPVGRTETDREGSIGTLTYRAYRSAYYHGEGDPALFPPEAWVELAVVFEKENIEYTMRAGVPQTEEEAAEQDLADLLLSYAGTHTVPDLGSFRYGEYLLRDDALTPEAARADPDFGAYLPAAAPEGFAVDWIRRYQLADVQNYLRAFWIGDGGNDLDWMICTVTEETRSRLVSVEEPEKYDLSLYPRPWASSVPPEYRLTVENPVFRIGELTREAVDARVHTGDQGQPMLRFGVLLENGILVSVNSRGADPGWVYEALANLR